MWSLTDPDSTPPRGTTPHSRATTEALRTPELTEGPPDGRLSGYTGRAHLYGARLHVREYNSAKWVSTEETSWSMDKAAFTAFRRLFKYINGDTNKEGTKIEMTSPVIIKSFKKKGLFSYSKYTMSFLLPSVHQLHPPEPTDSQVKVSTLPYMQVYVRGYGAWMMSVSDWFNTRRLSESLDSVGASYFGDYHYAVGYDSPMKITNRHNEVWFVVKDEPVCPDAP
ncbi:hypothetical protein CRUP_012868 [Coryphaenoides rupestris]|nr:hypothetical protein CRUP_012868 [Coryphaenoides rupestris]